VGEVGIWKDSELQWRLSWRRNQFVWKHSQEEELISDLLNVKLNMEVQDRKVWKGDESSCFSVKTTYKCLSNYVTGTYNATFKHLWMSKALPKVLTMAWRVLLERLPTRVNLSRRGVTVSTSNCALCHGWEESNQHLFLECKISYQVWNCHFR